MFGRVRRYDGPVVFVQGVHYPTRKDGTARKRRPLRWDENGYRRARRGEAKHNEAWGGGEVELEVGGE